MILKETKTPELPTTLRAEKIVSQLYALRKAFETDYSGVLRSRKYQASREFTIALNHTIFEANQMLGQNDGSIENTISLQKKIEILKQDFQNLLD